jgi:16S rRNA (adenine1518-N6/adenine1519-N6)-dimethyltransferase
MQHKPRKRFGQHFLHDPQIIQRIIRVIDPQPTEIIVEIGPGLGALTLPLLNTKANLQAIEFDRDLILFWKQNYPQLQIHAGDALLFDFAQLSNAHKIKVVGNLPYNISTPLIFHLLDQISAISEMIFMVQKEVADRLIATPNERADYGRLSIMVQCFCKVETLFQVGAGAFTPPPKVESTVIRLIPHEKPLLNVEEIPHFSRFIAQSFSQRRKTLRNNLKSLVDETTFLNTHIDQSARPETLSVEDFIRLFNHLS